MLFPLLFWCKALGTKRLASEELGYDWDNKRLNVGSVRILFPLLLSDSLTTVVVLHALFFFNDILLLQSYIQSFFVYRRMISSKQ